MKQKKLLLAGSHAATTAVATIYEIKAQKLNWKLYWVGNETLPTQGVISQRIESGKIENKFTKNTIFSFLKIPFGFMQAGFRVVQIKPNLILSFGGATGAQVAFWGWLFGISVIIHEQTSVAGRANIKSSKFAKKIAISRNSSRVYFPTQKTVLTGNPISKSIIKLAKFKSRKKVETIFITGGSRGSKWINDAIKPNLNRLLKNYKVIFLTGEKHVNKFTMKNSNLTILGRVDSDKYAELLKKSDIVIARAGANTVSELIVFKKPCILIPIPWSYKNEQTKNAKKLEKTGLARIIKQSELTPQRLYGEIESLIKNYSKIIEKTKNIVSSDIHASEKLVDLLQDNL